MATEAKVQWRKADNRRIARLGALGGWDLMRHRSKVKLKNAR